MARPAGTTRLTPGGNGFQLNPREARVNVSEADFLGNHCVVVVASFGWLIQTAPGSAGGAGGLLTKRSGCWV
jgi:hypothetical protein